MTKQLLLIALTTVFAIIARAQNEIKMPSILPASPEASAINKGAALSVGMFTGAANASIPLYDLKVGSLAVPVSLNYSGNGLKVDEIPGRTGLGWNLSTAGVISRIVHDLPDDNSTRVIFPTDFPSTNQATYDVLYQRYHFGHLFDTEPDEFRADAPGLSVKFVIDDDGNPLIIPHSNDKITITRGGGNTGNEFKSFTITNANGIKYTFGGTDTYGNNAIEVTKTHNVDPPISTISRIRTAFYLTSINAPNNDYINYFYNQIKTINYLGVSNTLTRRVGAPDDLECACGTLPPNPPSPSTTFAQKLNNVTYETVYLSSFNTSNNQYVSLYYENRFDGYGDNRIKSINIAAGNFVKNYSLKYDDPSTNNQINYFNNNPANRRFFLSEVETYINNNTDVFEGFITVDTLKYKIEYYNNDNLPNRLAYSQDHLGFNNGQNNQNLLPINQLPTGFSSNANANRNFNGNIAKNGMLKKVTVPTGGYEEFVYEPNKKSYYQLVNTTTTKTVSGQGNNNGSLYTPTVYYSAPINILRNQTVNITTTVGELMPCYGSYPQCEPYQPNTSIIVKVEILSGTSVINTLNYKNYGSYNVALPLGIGNYTIKLTVRGFINIGNVEIRYDYAAQNQFAWADQEIGGIRVKQVNSFDPVSSKLTTKYFKYTKLNSPINNIATTMQSLNYFKEYHIVKLCPPTTNINPNNTTINYTTSGCYNTFQSSNYHALNTSSTHLLYTYNGSPVAYPYVIESDDIDFKNGGTEHTFAVQEDIPNNPLLGTVSLFLPSNTNTLINGVETNTKIFNNNKQILKEQLNFYKVNTIVDKRVNATALIQNYAVGSFLHNVPTPWFNLFDMFSASRYYHTSNWIQQDSSITIDYDLTNNTSIKTKQIIGYGNPINVQPKNTSTTNSRGDIITSELKYPTDFTGAPFNKMLSKNILTPVVETETFTNSISTGKIHNEFIDWHPGGVTAPVIIAPKRIFAKRGSYAEEPRIQYYAYDIKGHPLEVSKEQGIRVSYIWDYNGDLPIAEFKNASITTDNIAYTSFEADGKGNWNFNGSAITGSIKPPTGSKCYDLSTGDINSNINNSKAYYVTYWLQNGTGSVSVNSIAATLLIKRNGWSCYQHIIPEGNREILITGTGNIDELRLYPEGSFVTTTTYIPFIGLTSRNEANNQITYYEYDGASRLTRIRNMDLNIVKQMDYHYQKTIAPCPNATANWIPTGNSICEQAGPNNNFTGNRLQEEMDMNNCSPTYLTKQYTALGNNGIWCRPILACTGADKRVVTTAGVAVCETGSKILLTSIQIGPSNFQCTFKYVWIDGFSSPDFIEISTTGCTVLVN